MTYADPLYEHRQRQWQTAASAIERASSPALRPPSFAGKTVRQLLKDHPSMREVLIDGILRRGEIVNIIGASKSHKSFTATDLAICCATGRPWLGRHAVRRVRVLILDNELHAETSADRIPRIAAARGVPLDDFADVLTVENLRGNLVDIVAMEPYFASIGPGVFDVVVLDALYRFLPPGVSENDNGAMTQVYNRIDRYAKMLGCAFIIVHHAAKGGQAARAVTDVGAGAGAQSRAADMHLILRQHQDPGVVVLESAPRTWPLLAPVCLRWSYPVFTPDDSLDPALLHRSEKRTKGGDKPAKQPPATTPEQFAARFITTVPALPDAIIRAAADAGMTKVDAKELLGLAEDQGLAFRHQRGPSDRVRFANVPPAGAGEGGGGGVCSPPTPPRERQGVTGVGGGAQGSPPRRRTRKARKGGGTP